tara:strand:+ start:230 stop:790 length:561 start_codon:yes stop_codon:yes gene_type:complete
MNNQKLLAYLGCGILIVAVIYFVLTVLTISGDTFKRNVKEGFKFGGSDSDDEDEDDEDDEDGPDPKLKRKRKSFNKACDKALGDEDSDGILNIAIDKSQEKLEELEYVLGDNKEELMEKFNTLADIEFKIQQLEGIYSRVNKRITNPGADARGYVTMIGRNNLYQSNAGGGGKGSMMGKKMKKGFF